MGEEALYISTVFYYSTYNNFMLTITILMLPLGPDPDKTCLEVSYFFLFCKRHYAFGVDAIVFQGRVSESSSTVMSSSLDKYLALALFNCVYFQCFFPITMLTYM